MLWEKYRTISEESPAVISHNGGSISSAYMHVTLVISCYIMSSLCRPDASFMGNIAPDK